MRHTATIGVLAALLVLSTSTLTSAGEDSGTERVVPEIRAKRANPHAPVIDGNLDDPIWTGGFIDIVRVFSQ